MTKKEKELLQNVIDEFEGVLFWDNKNLYKRQIIKLSNAWENLKELEQRASK